VLHSHPFPMPDQEETPQDPKDPQEEFRQFNEMISKLMGQGGAAFTFPGQGATAPAPKDPAPAPPPSRSRSVAEILAFPYRPADLKAHLDRYVIKQDEAKKVLSIAVCDHYHHARLMHRLVTEDPHRARQLEHHKQNVLILGPTGVGKTYLIKHIADLIGVPFVKADATKFSETGYVGGDVDDLVRELVTRADGDVALAEYGIIYIDEIDKLASPAGQSGRDVSGRGVQTTLLKLMEETDVASRNSQDIQAMMKAMMQVGQGGAPSKESINTRHILFVVSGAFSGLEKIIARRTREAAVGFSPSAPDRPATSQLLDHVSTQDLIDFGFEAEFVGRLPVRVLCQPLDADALFEIQTRSEGSLIRQLEREFEAYGIHATFSDDALRAAATRAAAENTGARGLYTVWERILRQFKFELPSLGLTSFHVDLAVFEDPDAALARLRLQRQAADLAQTAQQLEIFADDLERRCGVRLSFTQEATTRIQQLAAADGEEPIALCRTLFKDYEFGLNLLKQNSGTPALTLDLHAIEDPSTYLNDLVARSYREG
jgi:ATP-dependent Clp protease ATP-binding subunit ClpX